MRDSSCSSQHRGMSSANASHSVHLFIRLPGRMCRLRPQADFRCARLQALIHKSELSWDRVMRPEQVVRPGDKVQCKVTSVDQEKARVQLSLKRMQVPLQNPPLTRWTIPHTPCPECCASVKAQYQHADDGTVPLHVHRAGCCKHGDPSRDKLGHATNAWAF